jgi:hypothetical protein
VGTPKGIKAVTQVFDWRTVPIKRVDQLQMGWNSSRTAGLPLLPPRFLKKDEKKDDTTSSDAGARGKMTLPGAESGSGGGAGSGSSAKTVNGLEINRYLEVSEQVRRMPVGLALVVDQEHIQDVLTAIANSPLRIQTTQWHWRRFHGDIKPKDDESAPTTPTTPTTPTKGGAERPGAESVGPTLLPSGGKPSRGNRFQLPGTLGGPSMKTTTGEEQQDWDLVELAVYGIASLYERYLPKSADAATTATTGTMGATPSTKVP